MLNPKRLLKRNAEDAETTMWFWVWFAGAFAVMDTVAAAVDFNWLAAPTDVLWMLAATSWMVTATFAMVAGWISYRNRTKASGKQHDLQS